MNEKVSNITERNPVKILEIGSGRFPVSTFMSDESIRSGDIVTIDLNEGALRGVNPEVSPVVATAFQLPFPVSSFSNIVMSNVFGDPNFALNKRDVEYKKGEPPNEYWQERAQVLFGELSRVLSPKGELVVLEGLTPFIAEDCLAQYKDILETYFEKVEKSSSVQESLGENSALFGFRYDTNIFFRKK